MENDKEGCASPTPVAVESQFTACGENTMSAACRRNHRPKIPDAVDKIEVLRVVMRNFEEM